jgi:hypothetical protein
MSRRPLITVGSAVVVCLGLAAQVAFTEALMDFYLGAAMTNVVRAIAWLWGEPSGERRRKLGHIARLAPYPLSCQPVIC